LEEIGMMGDVVVGTVVTKDDPEIVRLFIVVRQVKPIPHLGPEALGNDEADQNSKPYAVPP
jgi:hypothetical protein